MDIATIQKLFNVLVNGWRDEKVFVFKKLNIEEPLPQYNLTEGVGEDAILVHQRGWKNAPIDYNVPLHHGWYTIINSIATMLGYKVSFYIQRDTDPKWKYPKQIELPLSDFIYVSPLIVMSLMQSVSEFLNLIEKE